MYINWTFSSKIDQVIASTAQAFSFEMGGGPKSAIYDSGWRQSDIYEDDPNEEWSPEILTDAVLILCSLEQVNGDKHPSEDFDFLEHVSLTKFYRDCDTEKEFLFSEVTEKRNESPLILEYCGNVRVNQKWLTLNHSLEKNKGSNTANHLKI